MKLYDIFQEDCMRAIRQIAGAKTAEERVEASLWLAKLKIDYYEEHANVAVELANCKKFYEEQLEKALWAYQGVIDEALDAGIGLDGLTYVS